MEAAVQKKAILLFEEEIIKRDWQNKVAKILDMHDETLLEVDKGMGVEVGKAMCDCYTRTGELLNQYFKDNLHLYSGGGIPKITCNFAGGYAVGSSYAECH